MIVGVFLCVLAFGASRALEIRRECSDPRHPHITCTAQQVDCSYTAPLVGDDLVPPEAHDLRVENFAKVNGKEGSHHLHVDISWQMPPNNDSFRVNAFFLEMNSSVGSECFLFDVKNYSWSANTSSPRFHFKTENFFLFGQVYGLVLSSLPRSKTHAPSITRHITMTPNPGHILGDDDNGTTNCSTQSNPKAGKWTSGFRKIFLHSFAKTIQIQFIAAPPSFCFKAYEVRLLDKTGLELLHSSTVKAADLQFEETERGRIYFGEHNFTDLEPGVQYIPSVMPMERGDGNRCLCPVESGPNDRHVVCSCIAADWKIVHLPLPGEYRGENGTMSVPPPPPPPPPQSPHSQSSFSPFSVIALIGVLTAFFALFWLIWLIFRRYRSRGKVVRTRFIPDRGTPAQTQLLIPGSCGSWSVLLIYSHDCPLHEDAVVAFAELLRDSFRMNVQIDKWAEEEIEKNLHDYINNSIVRADKVVIVNSIGACLRVQGRQKREPVERIHPGPLDGIYEAQIDLALQHARVISIRMSYTPSSSVLFSLSPLLQYTVPDNLPLLVAALTESPIRNDPRLTGFEANMVKLTNAVHNMQQYIENQPDWFDRTHHRISRTMAPLPQPLPVFVKPPPPEVEDVMETEELNDNEEQQLIPSTSDEVIVFEQNEEEEAVPDSLPQIPQKAVDSGGEDSGLHSDFVADNDRLSEESNSIGEDPPLKGEKSLHGDSGLISDYHSGLIQS